MSKEKSQNIAIREITQKQVWEDFLMECQEKTFLHSWNWGEFQKKMRGKIWRFGVYENSDLIGVALAVKVKAKRGSFLLIPHGPIINPKPQCSLLRFCGSFGGQAMPNQTSNLKPQILEILVEKLKEIAKQEKCSFIRIATILERNQDNTKIFKECGFRRAPIQTHPEDTWKLDISLPEDELLKNMRKTTRYLIKQALKNKDIEIFQTQKLEDLEIFNELHKQVSKTQKFIPFSIKYLKNEFLAFDADKQVSLFFGKYKGEVIAVSFVVFWSGIGFYHHAALLPKFRKIPIAYLLQWEAIREAKKRGCSLYDFWGYVDNPRHPWYGPTLFKMGFGGYSKHYVKTQDFVLSQKYWLNYIIEFIRKKKRGL